LSGIAEATGFWLRPAARSVAKEPVGTIASRGYVQLAQIPDYYKLSDDLVIYGKRLDGC
jgi:hypothetical protein